MASPPLKFSDLHRVAFGSCDDFFKTLHNLGVTLPLNVAPDCKASLVDAQGVQVVTVDVDGVLPDEDTWQIALWIMTAVNTCGGFKAERA